VDKKSRRFRTSELFPPQESGEWWTASDWRWNRSSRGEWFLCAEITPSSDARARGVQELPFGLIGAEVEWHLAEPAVMHRELAELAHKVAAANDFDAALRDAILPLVRRVGWLHLRIHDFEPDGKSGTSRRGEPFTVWHEAVLECAALTRLLDVWRSRDRDALNDTLTLYRSENRVPDQLLWWWQVGSFLVRHEQVAVNPSGPWILEPDRDSRERREHDRIMALAELWDRDPFAVAYRVLAEWLNRRLAAGVRLAAPLEPPRSWDKAKILTTSPVPLNRAYLQLLQEMQDATRFRKCKYCARWMDLDEMPTRSERKRRSDTEYHPNCRKAAYRAKGLPAPRLCRLAGCGADLTGTVGQTRYCSRDHWRLDYNRRRRAVTGEERN
jgi:hypothetical protein